MSVAEIAPAFATVFLAELPDKTMVATIVLVARYRHAVAVWLGATVAFALHVTVAVVAGSAVGQLPDRLVAAVVFVLFAGGAVAMLVAARRSDRLEASPHPAADPNSDVRARLVRAAAGSFAFIALAEWGDLTQIATAGLAARSDAPVATWAGAITALAAVAAIAAAAGNRLIAVVPVRRIQFVAAGVFGALAVWALVDLIRTD